MGTVYGIGLADGPVRYVGLTTKTPAQRLREHLYFAAQGRPWPISCWLRKHPDAQIRVLEEYEDLDQLKVAEIRLITELSTHVDQGGLNATIGGDGLIGASDEVKNKIRASVIAAQQANPQLLDNLRKFRVGQPAWNRDRTGSKHSAVTKAKMSASHQGQDLSSARAALTPEVIARRTQSIRHAWHVKKDQICPDCTLCSIGGVRRGRGL